MESNHADRSPSPAGTARTGERRRGFPRRIGSLEEVFRFLDETLVGTKVADRTRMVLHLAVEELFTNMVKYNSATGRDIVITVAVRGDRVLLELMDPDAVFFDPEAVAPPGVDRPIAERRPGGLGLYLVRSLADSVDYSYHDRQMTVSVMTRLE